MSAGRLGYKEFMSFNMIHSQAYTYLPIYFLAIDLLFGCHKEQPYRFLEPVNECYVSKLSTCIYQCWACIIF
jgi:hypothetical protein